MTENHAIAIQELRAVHRIELGFASFDKVSTAQQTITRIKAVEEVVQWWEGELQYLVMADGPIITRNGKEHATRRNRIVYENTRDYSNKISTLPKEVQALLIGPEAVQAALIAKLLTPVRSEAPEDEPTDLYLAWISLYPSPADGPVGTQNLYQWQVSNGTTAFDPEADELDGGWCAVASEDTEEWIRQADEHLRLHGFERACDWKLHEPVSSALVRHIEKEN